MRNKTMHSSEMAEVFRDLAQVLTDAHQARTGAQAIPPRWARYEYAYSFLQDIIAHLEDGDWEATLEEIVYDSDGTADRLELWALHRQTTELQVHRHEENPSQEKPRKLM